MTWEAAVIASIVWFALAMLRVAPVVVTLPVFGARLIPSQVQIPLLIVLTAGALPAYGVGATPAPALGLWVVAAAMRELTFGLVLALIVGAPFFALDQGGRLLDGMRGVDLSEPSPLSRLARMTFGVVFLAAGGLRAVMRLVAESFTSWPVRADATLVLAHPVDVAARWSAMALEATITLFGAALLAMALLEIALAFAARVSPPLGRSHIALPLRAVAPLVLVALTVAAWTGAARDFATSALAAARGFAP